MNFSFLSSKIFNDYHKLLGLSFLMTLAAAYFSIGSHHPDEHFQILEFAWYHLGNSDASTMPWEFHEKIRPTLQPVICMFFMKVMALIGVDNPFTISFVLRLLTGIFSWVVSILLINLFIKDFKTQKGRIFLVVTTLFLWFVPYLHVRFSSETLSGYTFILGLLILLKFINSIDRKRFMIIISGLMFGFSFDFRFQIGGALLGLFIWLIFLKKIELSNFLILIFTLLIAVSIGVISDIWFYGEWVFTPWNYLYFNLVLGKASEFGTNPWWYYFYLFFIKVIPPISILLLLFFIMGAIRNKYSVLLWIIVPFFVIHMLIGHKEMRFLFPVFPLFVVLVSLGFDYLISGMKRKGLLLVVYCTFGINICLFLFRTFIPAQILFSYHRYLYQIAEDQNYLLISINQAPYDYVGLPVSFYRSPNIETKHFETYDQVESYIENHQDKPILFLHTTQVLDYEFSGFKSKRIYTILPEWISKFNINNWQSRSRIYSIYSLDKVKTL